VSKTQLEIDFTPGLTEQFPDFLDCIKASVYGCGRPFKSIAADVEMSPSELSRKLANNANDPVHFPAKELPALIAATKDLMPVYWLVEKFCENSDAKQRRAIEALAQLSRDLPRMLKSAGIKP
jgi:hypothetical protein